MGKLEEFIRYLQEQVDNHSVYVWGGQGEQDITEAWIRKMETSTANADRAIAYWKKQLAAGHGGNLRAFDCSGLGVYWLLANGLIKGDTTAEGLRKMCDAVSTPRKGDFVFRVSRGNAYHVGYVINDALSVVESKGRDYGVCITRDIYARNGYWTHYGRPTRIFGGDALDIEPQPVTVQVPELSRVLKLSKPYMQGDDVQQAQRFLINALCSCGSSGADGVFGGGTDKAVRAYQHEKHLKEDGVIGQKTWETFGGKWVG